MYFKIISKNDKICDNIILVIEISEVLSKTFNEIWERISIMYSWTSKRRIKPKYIHMKRNLLVKFDMWKDLVKKKKNKKKTKNKTSMGRGTPKKKDGYIH